MKFTEKHKFLQKAVACLTAATLLTSSFCGCSPESAAYKSIDGYEEAANAKKLYAALDSGHLTTVDNSTGNTTMEFSFMYRPDGNLMYSSMSSEGDQVLYEFHNGSEINRREGGSTDWTFILQGEEDYYVYTRDDPHPYTTEGVISVNAYALTDSKVEDAEDGGKKITFYYDPAQLASALAELGELQSFESTIWLNSEGYCFRLDQKAVFDNGGKEEVSDFSMYIDQMNEITHLSRPEI